MQTTKSILKEAILGATQYTKLLLTLAGVPNMESTCWKLSTFHKRHSKLKI
jgi:hypothetical protein